MRIKIICSLAGLLFLGSGRLFAQCDQNTIIKTSSTSYCDSTGKVQRTEEQSSVIEISKTNLVIKPGDKVMEGIIKSVKCSWTEPYKNGTTVIKAEIDKDGNPMPVTMTLTGKAGVVSILFNVDAEPNRWVKLTADSFAEKKDK